MGRFFGTLPGTVKDASGAVVPGAKVLITNTDEGSSQTTTTDSSRNYMLVDAKPGHYMVAVSKAGFHASQVTGLDLTACQALRADVTLKVGEVTQSVTINGQAIGMITTDNSTISANYQDLEINNFPTNHRASGNGNSPYYLLTILPGMQPDQHGNLSIQGGLRSPSRFIVDGISTTDNTGNSPLLDAFPSAESLVEMRVQGVVAPAEYGAPADIATISKSGTNQYHGGGFWHQQNAALDVIPFGASSKPKKVANAVPICGDIKALADMIMASMMEAVAFQSTPGIRIEMIPVLSAKAMEDACHTLNVRPFMSSDMTALYEAGLKRRTEPRHLS